MESNDAFQPPPCTEAGKRCTECWNGDNSECGFQKLGQRALEQTLRIIVLEEDKEKGQIELVKRDERLELLSHDSKTGFLTLEGLYDYVQRNTEMQEAIRKKKLGALHVDLRFLTLANDIDHSAGDKFISTFADRMTFVLRTNPGTATDRKLQSNPEKQRRADSPNRDIIVARIGGDEFIAFIIDVSPEEFNSIYKRANDEIGSIDKATRAGQSGELPLLASIGAIHLSRLEAETDAPDDHQTINALIDSADKAQQKAKNTQYEELIKVVGLSGDGINIDEFFKNGKIDTRRVSYAYLNTCCHAFVENAREAIYRKQ